MKRIFKLLHLLGVIGFAGASLVALVLTATAPDTTAESFAVSRSVISAVCLNVAAPALLVAIGSGIALMVSQPAYLRARWVRAKWVIATLIVLVTLMGWLPAVQRLETLAQSAAFGAPILHAQTAVARTEWIAGAAVVALALVAIVLGVWRPRLGDRRAERDAS